MLLETTSISRPQNKKTYRSEWDLRLCFEKEIEGWEDKGEHKWVLGDFFPWWLSGKSKWRAEWIDGRGRGRMDLEAAQQCLSCRKAGLFTETYYKEAYTVLKGLQRYCIRASALESGTLSGVRVTVEAVNRASSLLILCWRYCFRKSDLPVFWNSAARGQAEVCSYFLLGSEFHCNCFLFSSLSKMLSCS